MSTSEPLDRRKAALRAAQRRKRRAAAAAVGAMPRADALVVSPRILLLPLLAFDRQGRRLGHGAGSFDMVLRNLRARYPGPIVISIAVAAQEVEKVPTGPRGQMLVAVVTERHLHRCPPRHAAALEAVLA